MAVVPFPSPSEVSHPSRSLARNIQLIRSEGEEYYEHEQLWTSDRHIGFEEDEDVGTSAVQNGCCVMPHSKRVFSLMTDVWRAMRDELHKFFWHVALFAD
ncbi:hypothetical protein KIN20_003202 [Parelaphostrongylus tenuis]|uniref:Uncharacterized protein n=1 Tax=Parelaphostrongylus tenuis TaxID=148309 RepID=A0AAD5QIF9_PARTN|nr:hypothetical protein KIN20_003202 [Parelaphostrongylus tenuis]